MSPVKVGSYKRQEPPKHHAFIVPLQHQQHLPVPMEDFDVIMSLITPKNVANRRVVYALLNYIDAIERVAIAKALILQDKQQKQQVKTRKPRSVRVWSYLERRIQYGHYDNLMQELVRKCPELYKNFTRIDRQPAEPSAFS